MAISSVSFPNWADMGAREKGRGKNKNSSHGRKFSKSSDASTFSKNESFEVRDSPMNGCYFWFFAHAYSKGFMPNANFRIDDLFRDSNVWCNNTVFQVLLQRKNEASISSNAELLFGRYTDVTPYNSPWLNKLVSLSSSATVENGILTLNVWWTFIYTSNYSIDKITLNSASK